MRTEENGAREFSFCVRGMLDMSIESWLSLEAPAPRVKSHDGTLMTQEQLPQQIISRHFFYF